MQLSNSINYSNVSKPFVISAIIMLFLGSFIGSLWMMSLFGINLPLQFANFFHLHRIFQIDGFITLLIMGIGYMIIPRFRNIPLPSIKLAYLSFFMMFGFTRYESLHQSDSNAGNIPFHHDKENTIGGHAIVVAGYDDNRKINYKLGDKETIGALLIRNSWGTGWGENGYGCLPYEYVLSGISLEVYTNFKNQSIIINVNKVEIVKSPKKLLMNTNHLDRY